MAQNEELEQAHRYADALEVRCARLLAAVKALRAVATWDDEYVTQEQCEAACAVADEVLVEHGEQP